MKFTTRVKQAAKKLFGTGRRPVLPIYLPTMAPRTITIDTRGQVYLVVDKETRNKYRKDGKTPTFNCGLRKLTDEQVEEGQRVGILPAEIPGRG